MMKRFRHIIPALLMLAAALTCSAAPRHTLKIRHINQPPRHDTLAIRPVEHPAADEAVIHTIEPDSTPATQAPAPVSPQPAAESAKPAAPKSNPQIARIAIEGEPEITNPEVIAAFVRRHNKDFPVEIAESFLRIGRLYGIRGDIALCQSILETGWFRFADGTAVTADQHNYCGMGVTNRGQRGATFNTIDDGVRAHIQHLFAYATRRPVPEGEPIVDPRFRLVTRGVAPTWADLANRWAMNPNYGNQIISLFNQLKQFADKQ